LVKFRDVPSTGNPRQTAVRPPSTGDEESGAVIHAVVFDLDGTLIDSAGELRAALNRALGALGRRPLSDREVTAMIGDGIVRLTERALAVTGVPLTDVALDRAVAAVKTAYATLPPSRLYSGAREILTALSECGIALALCTNKPVDATRHILDQLGLADLFQAVAGGDSYPTKKPDPMPVRGLLAQLGVAPAAAALVGDSSNDIMAGRAAGLTTVAVTYGYSLIPAHELGADIVVDRLADVITALHHRLPRP
jgi:phosphoglycolate phosphatase